MVHALLDSRRPPAVRRRVARMLAARPSARGADGLLAALLDDRFDIREQCARSLASIRKADATLPIDAARIRAAVIHEVSLGRHVWEGYRALADDETGQGSPLDEYIREPADRGLAHVFTLLSIVLPAEPLRIAYRGLHTDDPVADGVCLRVPVSREFGCQGLVHLRESLTRTRSDHRAAFRSAVRGAGTA